MTIKSKISRSLAILALLATLSGIGFVAHLAARHNFHSVSEGRVYRSAQMNGDLLAETIREHGIKTVVNLRGDNGAADWYQAEINTARQLGVRHFDFETVSASREVSNEDMEKILATIEHAPKPLLIHCKNGADRTGLIGARFTFTASNANRPPMPGGS